MVPFAYVRCQTGFFIHLDMEAKFGLSKILLVSAILIMAFGLDFNKI